MRTIRIEIEKRIVAGESRCGLCRYNVANGTNGGRWCRFFKKSSDGERLPECKAAEVTTKGAR